ncbi:hypothetical protein GQ602_004306 [Ophiocordyceps camponoti-floridani]|uniref:Uncharacterized protein n=1 Tax=Ophiocordyceps camponoti-floridani TaxID=2030778 RepID=A0A8H4Q6N4_9HYPO|nr:hypothetical protein GQ602_004306 [Ophiocordyceps camponoti-floridani]
MMDLESVPRDAGVWKNEEPAGYNTGFASINDDAGIEQMFRYLTNIEYEDDDASDSGIVNSEYTHLPQRSAEEGSLEKLFESQMVDSASEKKFNLAGKESGESSGKKMASFDLPENILLTDDDFERFWTMADQIVEQKESAPGIISPALPSINHQKRMEDQKNLLAWIDTPANTNVEVGMLSNFINPALLSRTPVSSLAPSAGLSVMNIDSSAVADSGHRDESEHAFGDSATAASLSGLSASDEDSTGKTDSSTCNDGDDDACSVSTVIHHDVAEKGEIDFETLERDLAASLETTTTGLVDDDDNCSVTTEIHHDISGKADLDFEILQQHDTDSLFDDVPASDELAANQDNFTTIHHDNLDEAVTGADSVIPNFNQQDETNSLLHHSPAPAASTLYPTNASNATISQDPLSQNFTGKKAASIIPQSKKSYGALSLFNLPKALPQTPIPESPIISNPNAEGIFQ